MASGQRVRASGRGHIERPSGREARAAGLTILVLGAAAMLAAAPVWAQFSAQPSDSAAWAQKRRPPAPADISDCSRWATTASGFNPGANKLPPAWDKPKPRSISAETRYNRSMGACLGQREPPAR